MIHGQKEVMNYATDAFSGKDNDRESPSAHDRVYVGYREIKTEWLLPAN
jgi:hypothetical protein